MELQHNAGIDDLHQVQSELMDVVHRWRGLGCALGLQATVTPPTTITSELGIIMILSTYIV